MSTNSSSAPPLSSINSYYNLISYCLGMTPSLTIFSIAVLGNVLCLPVIALVLHQRWRERRLVSAATTTAAMSHCDLFTFHSVAMHLIQVLGFAATLVGHFVKLPKLMVSGFLLLSITSIGQSLFHVLTCVERYLAVVHPVLYLGLRRARWIRIRNVGACCIWLFSIGLVAALFQTSSSINSVAYLCFMIWFLAVVGFCSTAVLCALRRPAPGAVGGARGDQVDQLKQRAFHTIMAILVVLVLRFAGNVLTDMVSSSLSLGLSQKCLVVMLSIWCDVPTCFVLPVLFLYRTGRLGCCRQTPNQEESQ